MSTRPDGTLRKPVKVRPGYSAPEEIDAYVPEKMRGKLPAGYMPGFGEQPAKEHKSKNQRRNENKRNNRLQEQQANSETAGTGSKPLSTTITNDNHQQQPPAPGQPIATQQNEQLKSLRALEKKLRQINDLEARPQEQLGTDQLAKLKTKQAVIAEIKRLSSQI